MSATLPLDSQLIASANADGLKAAQEDYDALARSLARAGIEIETARRGVAELSLALPSWGAGVGGTRFARFPIAGEPTDVFEKVEDCAVVQQLCRITPRVSPHFPWDRVSDLAELKAHAAAYGLGFDAVNSNTFQDQPGQTASYRRGGLSSVDPAARELAIAHNLECIEIGQALGSTALTVWIGDGGNLPGQQNIGRAFDRYLESMAAIYAGLPDDWRLLIEHKMYEPAFYTTVVADWGTSLMAAQALGPQALCLVDLGHHAPNTNIEQIVERLGRVGRLGGFHFNDSKYGDDDLDSGSINPHQLFLIFNELIELGQAGRPGPAPAYMIDQSHNVTDPIESLLSSAEAIATAFCKALLVDRRALARAQDAGDAMAAFQALRDAYRRDVSPILALARVEAGGAVDPLAVYRRSDWRRTKASQRRATGGGAGIV